jgi:hypothetical protein
MQKRGFSTPSEERATRRALEKLFAVKQERGRPRRSQVPAHHKLKTLPEIRFKDSSGQWLYNLSLLRTAMITFATLIVRDQGFNVLSNLPGHRLKTDFARHPLVRLYLQKRSGTIFHYAYSVYLSEIANYIRPIAMVNFGMGRKKIDISSL